MSDPVERDGAASGAAGAAAAGPAPSRAGVALIAVCAAAALVLSGVLLARALSSGDLPGCGEGSGCDAVLSSKWAKVPGLWDGAVPVSAPAVAVYAAMLGAALHARSARAGRRRGAWAVLLFTGTLAAAAAVWFLAVQALEVGAWCRYCTAAHGAGLVAAVAVWRSAPLGRGGLLPWSHAAGYGLMALVPAAVFFAAQTSWEPQTHRVVAGEGLAGTGPMDTGPGPGRVVGLANGTIRLRPHEFPIVGSPDARVVLAELMDYTCPHCRELHRQLEGVRHAAGEGGLAVVTLPMPLDRDCNPLVREQHERHETACELAELALGVWLADPAWFEAYHHWLLTTDPLPSPEAARARAVDLVGEAGLDAALADPRIGERIERNIKTYGLFRRSLPILFLPTSVVYGRPGTEAELRELVFAETGLGGGPAGGERGGEGE